MFAALATAAAIMTKGIFILVTIGGGFLFYLISIKGLRQLLHYRWLLFILLVLIFITPELYSLYTQFDLHPEKVVFGTTSVSGIRFFLWDSQFGRFFNTGPIKGSGDLMFFFHTTLWAFLPWSLLLIAAVWNLARRPVSNKLATIISGSALLSFIMFSLSRFQLPHYLVILFPHFSLITGRYINGLKNIKTIRIWNWIQSTILVILPIIILSLYIYSGLVSSVMAWLPGTAIIVLTLLIFRKNVTTDILIKGVIFTTVLFYFMNLFFYPSLLKYQSGMVAAKAINKIAPAEQPFLYMNNSWTFQFYCMKPPIQINNDSLKNYKFESVNAFVRQQDLAYLDSSVYKYSVIQQFDHFHVSILNREFLNKETREKNLNKAMLIKIYTR